MNIANSEKLLSKGCDDTLDNMDELNAFNLERPLFKCTICNINYVDAANGIDTCDTCLSDM